MIVVPLITVGLIAIISLVCALIAFATSASQDSLDGALKQIETIETGIDALRKEPDCIGALAFQIETLEYKVESLALTNRHRVRQLSSLVQSWEQEDRKEQEQEGES